MPSESHQGRRLRFGASSARHEAATLAAYHAALDEFADCRGSHELLEHLGDVDQQATHPLADARLALAGRLIAAAQVSEPVQLPEPHVQGIIRAWLTNREAERDDAAPTFMRRVPPDDEHISGLTQRLIDTESQGGFSRAAWGIAGLVLQQLIHPTVEVSRALAVRETLNPLATTAVELTETPRPPDAGDDALNELLSFTVVRLRDDGSIVADDAADRRHRHEAWLRIAGDAVRAHAWWSKTALTATMDQALARATERLAASLVRDQPKRFDHEAALQQVIQAAFDAAVTALGMTIQPADPVFVRGKPDVLEGLLEASSSGLIGAWVVDRAAD